MSYPQIWVPNANTTATIPVVTHSIVPGVPMTDEDVQRMNEASLAAPNYAAPSAAASNADAGDVAALRAAVADLQARLASNAPPVGKSPDEVAHDALENGGAGLGVDERLAELYRVVKHLAAKVGL